MRYAERGQLKNTHEYFWKRGISSSGRIDKRSFGKKKMRGDYTGRAFPEAK